MPEQIHPLYVNGPLAGQDHPVERDLAITRHTAVYAQDDDHFGMYQIAKYGLVGRDGSMVMLWLAWFGNEPTAAELAEHLLSGRAKAAITAPLPPPGQ